MSHTYSIVKVSVAGHAIRVFDGTYSVKEVRLARSANMFVVEVAIKPKSERLWLINSSEFMTTKVFYTTMVVYMDL